VLEQLPEGLAMSVLAASPADLDHQLDILPASLHRLAIEAALPSIRRHHSLTLSFGCLGDKDTGEREGVVTVSPAHGHAVLHAARTANSALEVLDLRNIRVKDNIPLLQLISAACMSPLDIRLSFNLEDVEDMSECSAFSQIVEAFSSNTALTRLSLDMKHDSNALFDYDSLLAALTQLQSLTLTQDNHLDFLNLYVPAPRGIVNLLSLTHLCLGPGFALMDFPQVVCHMTQLQALLLRVYWDSELRELPSLSHLTALKTLELHVPSKVELLPPLATLTLLQARHLILSIAPSTLMLSSLLHAHGSWECAERWATIRTFHDMNFVMLNG
jgi:hypothetical protein